MLRKGNSSKVLKVCGLVTIIGLVLFILLPAQAVADTLHDGDQPDKYVNPREQLLKDSTADHTKFEVLKKEFKTA